MKLKKLGISTIFLAFLLIVNHIHVYIMKYYFINQIQPIYNLNYQRKQEP